MSSPYEIRLELLKMSKDLLTDAYNVQKESAERLWEMQLEQAQKWNDLVRNDSPGNMKALPNLPTLPVFPTPKDIMEYAKSLNEFVSNAFKGKEKSDA